MGVLVPWDYHSGKLLQQRVKRKAGYGHIGYSLDEIELMFSNVVNCIDDFSRAKALKPFETLAARITDQVLSFISSLNTRINFIFRMMVELMQPYWVLNLDWIYFHMEQNRFTNCVREFYVLLIDC